MEQEKRIDVLDDYIKELKKQNIDKIAFCETNEKRALQQGKQVDVVHILKLEILGYKDSVIYKCILKDADLDSTFDILKGQGFEITRKNRNIT